MNNAPQGKIGRYVVQGELGRGAMGVVYRALDPAIGRTVAVKTIRIGQFTDEREIRHVQERMMREAQAAGILSHTNIVTIYDIQHEADTAFIFMEFVDGETLEKILLSDRPIDRQLILYLLKQAAEALDYAHQRGIIHRDVKPANIMVGRDSVAKIADFGIARMQSHSMTQAGQILGTPNYMSPEQISGKPVDGRADQYSLAVILYEVLTGEKPFVADSLPTLLFKVVSEPPQPAPRLNPTLSPAIDEVLQKALAKTPQERYPTCTEFMRNLERACLNAPGWTTQVRGGGLAQPTFAGPIQQAQPRQVQIPHNQATMGSAQNQAPMATRPVQPAPVPAQAPKPNPAAKRSAKAQKFNMAAVVAVALGSALIGAIAIGAKLIYDKRQTTQVADAPAVTAPAVTAPTPTEPVKSTPSPKPVAVDPTPPPSKPIEPPKTYEPKQPAPTHGNVMAVAIRTTPEGARVLVDDGSLPPCTSPCLVELGNGRHTATVSLDTYKTERRVFNVPQEATLMMNLVKVKGFLEVSSTPPGATITIDGAENEQKTPARIPLVVGKHTVVITLAGKPTHTQTFEMRADATISLNPNW